MHMWQVLGIVLTVLVVIGLLVVFAPWLAALLFVALTGRLAIHTGRKHGMKSGVVQFLKHMLFDW